LLIVEDSMRHRLVGSIGLIAALVLLPSVGRTVLAQTRAVPRSADAKPSIPRTPDGKPDLQGAWSFATVTPFERPAALGEKAVLSDEEAAQIEEQAAAQSKQDEGRKRGTAADVGRAYNDFWYDRGTRVAGTRQSSIVVDPPNGRVPPLTPEAQARASARAAARKQRGPADGPEDRSLGERCIMGFNAGPPFAPSAYNNNIQVIQTKDYVVVMTEMVHDARIVPLDGRKRLPAAVRPWMGDSRGRWEGDTLVVETTNFSEKNLYRNATPALKLVERFTRTGADTLVYEFTINDPATWTAPWTARVPLEKLDGEIYEYACHEGNLGLEGIMKGSRADEANAQKPQ
jgi:hypothetical protein